jgi:hypothetical protein
VATPVATPTPIEPTPDVVPADPTLETPAPAA